jgi:hypothetical protein
MIAKTCSTIKDQGMRNSLTILLYFSKNYGISHKRKVPFYKLVRQLYSEPYDGMKCHISQQKKFIKT